MKIPTDFKFHFPDSPNFQHIWDSSRDSPIFTEDLVPPEGWEPSPVTPKSPDPEMNWDEVVPETEFPKQNSWADDESNDGAVALGESKDRTFVGASMTTKLDPYQIYCAAIKNAVKMVPDSESEMVPDSESEKVMDESLDLSTFPRNVYKSEDDRIKYLQLLGMFCPSVLRLI